MPTWCYPDGSKKPVTQDEYLRLQNEQDEAYHEAYALAQWFAQKEWEDEFGANNERFPFKKTMSIYTEAERLLQH